jgi:glycerol 3-phosphatase-1
MADVKEMEGRIPRLYGADASEIPGARALLNSLIRERAPWAIVTSGTVPLVSSWLEVLNLPRPEILVSAESVDNGKPDPTCYLMGREGLGLADPAKELLVLEDSPAGIKAGKAAGCKVLGLVTSHTMDQIVAAGPDWIVQDLDSVLVAETSGPLVTLEFSNVLRP